MPLYKVPEERHISTVETSKGYVAKLLQQPKPTVQKMCRIFDEGLARIKPSDRSKLIWTRLAAFAGDASNVLHHADNEWAWELAKKLYGEDFCLIAMGGILRWRISIRDEIWLLYVRDTGNVDPITEKRITISEYWIDEGFKPVRAKWSPRRGNRNAPPSTADILNLRQAWGVR